MYYCHRGHRLYNTYVDCHKCISLEKQKEQKRQDEQYYKYLSSHEYKDKCKQTNIRQTETKLNFINIVHSIVVVVVMFVKYLCNTDPIDIFHDVKILITTILLHIQKICVSMIRTIIFLIKTVFIIMTLLLVAISIIDTLKYYNKFSHLGMKLVPVQFINAFVANIKSML